MVAAIPRVYRASPGALGTTMPAEKKPNQATWRDWLPPGSPDPKVLLTREQIIETLRDFNSDGESKAKRTPYSAKLVASLSVTVNEMRYLEAQGVLPRPVRQWHEGAVRAVYPSWVALLVGWVRIFQLRGFGLSEIRPWIRANAAAIAQGITPKDAPSQVAEMALPAVVRRELQRLAQRHERLTGSTVTGIAVSITTADGQTTSYHIDSGNDNVQNEE